jgi:hypothetical protein
MEILDGAMVGLIGKSKHKNAAANSDLEELKFMYKKVQGID